MYVLSERKDNEIILKPCKVFPFCCSISRFFVTFVV